MLNFAAETVDCKQLILYVLILEMINYKIIYNDSNEFIFKLIQTLQLNNSLI